MHEDIFGSALQGVYGSVLHPVGHTQWKGKAQVFAPEFNALKPPSQKGGFQAPFDGFDLWQFRHINLVAARDAAQWNFNLS
jgi:hypothetical protein